MFALLIVMVMMVACCANALAITDNILPYSQGALSGGLTSQGGGKYNLWGEIIGDFNEALSITAELRTSSGSIIGRTYGSGYGPTVITQTEYVYLSSGTYYLYLYGTTSTDSPSKIVTIRI